MVHFEDVGVAQSYTGLGLNKVVDTVASCLERKCSPDASLDTQKLNDASLYSNFMYSVTPVRRVFQSNIVTSLLEKCTITLK